MQHDDDDENTKPRFFFLTLTFVLRRAMLQNFVYTFDDCTNSCCCVVGEEAVAT